MGFWGTLFTVLLANAMWDYIRVQNDIRRGDDY